MVPLKLGSTADLGYTNTVPKSKQVSVIVNIILLHIDRIVAFEIANVIRVAMSLFGFHEYEYLRSLVEWCQYLAGAQPLFGARSI